MKEKKHLRVGFIVLCFVACMIPITTAAKEPCEEVCRWREGVVGLAADGIPAGKNSGDAI